MSFMSENLLAAERIRRGPSMSYRFPCLDVPPLPWKGRASLRRSLHYNFYQRDGEKEKKAASHCHLEQCLHDHPREDAISSLGTARAVTSSD